MIDPALVVTTEAGIRKRELTPFEVDGEVFYAVKPKGGMMLNLAVRANMVGDEMAQAQLVDDFLTMIMDSESGSEDRLRERLDDPDDNFDVDHLTIIINGLQAVWGKGQSTKSPRSSARRRRTGPRSTATARAGG
jgi:hypothetical protein